jgi:hypothetical protein
MKVTFTCTEDDIRKAYFAEYKDRVNQDAFQFAMDFLSEKAVLPEPTVAFINKSAWPEDQPLGFINE